MAITVQRLECFSTGDLTCLDATSGTPAVNNTNSPPNTKYALQIATGSSAQIKTVLNPTYTYYSFLIYFNGFPSSEETFMESYNSSGGVFSDFYLTRTTTGYIKVYNANSSLTITSNAIAENSKWLNITIICLCNGAGYFYLYLDGNLLGTNDSSDYYGANSDSILFKATSQTFSIAEFCCMTCVEADIPNLNINGLLLSEYMVSGTGYSTSGTALDSGTWANTGEQPYSESNVASYTASSASGYAVCNGTVKSGPANYAIHWPIVAASWNFYAKRGTGGGSTHNLRYGNNVDGVTDSSTSLTTSYAKYIIKSYGGTQIPTNDEYFALGMSVSGAQDILLSEAYCYVAMKRPPKYLPNPLIKRRPYQVRI